MTAQRQQTRDIVPMPEPRASRISPRDSLTRLAALHDEAEETAVLANLLGRVPYAAAALGTLAIVTVAVVGIGASLAETIVWLFFAAGAVAALVRVYSNAIRTPFERAALRNFREDAKSVMLYAGFAWGSGAFLALPVATTSILLAVYGGGAAAIIAVLTRDRTLSLSFGLPAIVLPAIAAVLRPLAAGAGGLGLVLLTGLAVLASAHAANLIAQRSRGVPKLADLPLN